MHLKKVRLELGRVRGFPAGNPNHGYEFVAPLDEKGRLDIKAWPAVAQLCTMRHFAPGAEDVQGELICRNSGEWAFSYRLGDSDDEVIHQFARHELREGEYVSVTQPDGVNYPFKVVSVETLHVVPKGAAQPVASRR